MFQFKFSLDYASNMIYNKNIYIKYIKKSRG